MRKSVAKSTKKNKQKVSVAKKKKPKAMDSELDRAVYDYMNAARYANKYDKSAEMRRRVQLAGRRIDAAARKGAK